MDRFKDLALEALAEAGLVVKAGNLVVSKVEGAEKTKRISVLGIEGVHVDVSIDGNTIDVNLVEDKGV